MNYIHKLSLAMSLILALGLTSCTSGNDKHEPAGEAPLVVPDHIEKVTVDSVPLSDAQISELKEFVKIGRKIPDGSLVWKEKNESQTEIDRRNEKIEALDADGKAILARINADCEIQHPVTTSTPENQMPTAGSVTTQDKKSLIAGNRCPVNFESVERQVVTFSSFNPETSEYSGTFVQSGSAKQVVVAEDLIEISNVVDISTQTSGRGISEHSKASNRSYFETTITGAITTKSKKAVGIAASTKLLSLGKGEEPKHIQFSYVLKFKMETFEVVLVVYADQIKGGESKTSFNLNGKELSEQEAKDIFGSGFNFTVD